MSAFAGLFSGGTVRAAGVRGPAMSVRPSRPLYVGVVVDVERDGAVSVLTGGELVGARGLRGPLSVGDRVVFCGPGVVDPAPWHMRWAFHRIGGPERVAA